MSDLAPGYVYRWTCAINGKMYIGSHNGSNPRYVASSPIFKLAVKKHGIKNFSREILYVGDDFRAEEERWLIAVDAAASPMYYNIKNEAMGVSLPGAMNPMHKSHGRFDSEETRRRKGHYLGKSRPDHAERMTGENNPMYGDAAHAHGLVAYASSIKGKTFEEIHGTKKAMERLEKLRARKGNWTQNWSDQECPNCGLIGRGPNMSRYHFDNCVGTYEDRLHQSRVEKSSGPLACPYCDMRGGSESGGSADAAMYRWHFENCKFKPSTQRANS